MKVSIIVPVYNVEAYIERCLTSLVNQTLKEIEIIVVDDGSPDQSAVIIQRFVNDYPDKVSYYKKINGGLGDARNYGMQYAKGEYIGFLDSDDYVTETMYEKLYSKAQADGSDIVECDFTWVYDDKQIIDKATYQPYQSIHDLMAHYRVVAWNKIYRRELIHSIDIHFPLGVRYEDIPFAYATLPYVNKVSYVNESFIYYIQRGNSLSNLQNEKVRDIFIVLKETKRFYEERGLMKDYHDDIEYLFIRILLGSSFKRILGVPSKALRNQILKENWLFLNESFPAWKKNYQLKTPNKKKSLFSSLKLSFVQIKWIHTKET